MRDTAPPQISNEWYQALFKDHPEPMWFFDQETLAFLDVNQAAVNCYGYSYDEFLHLTIKDLRPPEGLSQLMAQLPQILSGPYRDRAVQYQKKDGSVIDADVAFHPLCYSNRSAIFVTVNNVTSLKQAEQQLRDVSRQYESLFLNHPDPIYSLDLNGRFTSINPAAAKIPGYAPQQIVGEQFSRFILPEDRDKALAHFQKAAAGKAQDFEIRSRHKDGRIVWFDVTELPIIVGNKIVGVYGIGKDITGQKNAEIALRHKTEQLRHALDAACMVMLEWDTVIDQVDVQGDLACIYGHCNTTGWKSSDDYFKQCPNEDKAHMLAEINRAAAQNIAYDIECRVIWPDGKTHWVEMRGRPFYNEAGHLCVIDIAMDVTYHKQMEEELERKVARRTSQLRKANDELNKLSAHLQIAREEERAQVARDIHDELGGVLAAIKFDLATFLECSGQEADAAQWRDTQAIRLIDSAIESLRRIIADLRPSILDDLGLWAALEWLAQECEKRLGIPCLYKMVGPEVQVPSDLSVAIFRVVQELLTNAARHSNARQMWLEVETTQQVLKLRVRDNGIGITKEQILASRSYGILGIHERVHFYNGMVRFVGRPGKGTTVSLKFPVAQA